VLIARGLIGGFIEMLGQDDLAENARAESDAMIAMPGRKVFTAPPAIPAGRMLQLEAQPVNFSAIYITDWLQSFAALAVENAGHSAGRDITMEQNAKLGEILDYFRNQPSAAHNRKTG
jgi:hypothetical protein